MAMVFCNSAVVNSKFAENGLPSDFERSPAELGCDLDLERWGRRRVRILSVGNVGTEDEIDITATCNIKTTMNTSSSVLGNAPKFVVRNTFVDIDVEGSTEFVDRRKVKSAPVGADLAYDSSDSDVEEESAEDDEMAATSNSLTDTTTVETSGNDVALVEDEPSLTSDAAQHERPHLLPCKAPKFIVKNTFVDIEVDPGSWFVAERKLKSAPAGRDLAYDSDESDTEDCEEASIPCLQANDCDRVVAADRTDSVDEVSKGDAKQKQPASNHLNGSVWDLSRCSSGSRALQEAFELATSAEERNELALELKGHIWDAAHDLHANYLVQKMIMLMHPRSLQFVIDELSYAQGAARLASQNKYACRVIQRLMEYCSPAQIQDIVEDLLSDALFCCCDRYGKYVMQSLLERGTTPQIRKLMHCLAQNACQLATHENGCCVIGKSMSTGLSEDRVCIAQAVVSVPGLVQSMSSPQGRFVARAIQAVATKAGSTNNELRRTGKTSVALLGLVDSGAGKNSRRGRCGGAECGQKKISSKKDGAAVQKESEARDLLESLRAACARRSPGKICKALDRVQNAFSTPWAPPALHIEALQCCEHARQLMWALSIETATFR